MKTLFIFLFTFYFAQTYSQSKNFIRADNNKLIDSSGKAVYLNGINLGGWLLWEGWIFGDGYTKESKMKERLQQLLGTNAYNDFLKKFYASFITERDIALIAKSGFNCIRLPFNYRIFNTGNNGFVILDSMVAWCKKYKVYLVLDMHAAPGGQSPYFVADPSGDKLWESDENKKQTFQLWLNIAERYKDEKVIAGYDLLNEPDVNKQSTLISFYKDLVKAIRLADANHLLFVEGNKLAHNFKDFPSSIDNNQVYSYHYYPWFAENNKANDLKNITQTIKTDLPLWCGEWGEDTPPNLQEVRTLLDQQENLCGTAFWTWKRIYKNNNRKPFYTIRSSLNWDKIMTWLSWNIGKPNKAQVQKGVEEFLNNIRVENCILNPEVQAAIKH